MARPESVSRHEPIAAPLRRGSRYAPTLEGDWIDNNVVSIVEKIGDAFRQLPFPIPLPVPEGLPVPLSVP